MEQLIISYYNAILRVDPTQDQIDLWLNLIDPNDPEPGIEDLTDALCFQADEVLSIMRIYQVVLGRVPDPGGLDFWVQVFRDMQDANPGLSYREALVETIRDWLSSDEFVSVYGDNLSDEEYVALLYINVLNRPPDQAGFNFWVNELKSGAITREGLVIAFSESEEFKMMVDAEAKGILLYDAQTSSTDPIDDPDYEIPGNNPYQGELQNEAPVDIQIGTDVDENAADGTVVNEGQLTAVDPDGGETFTWELVDDAGGAFELDDASAQQPNIVVADGSLLDHETDPVMTVRVRVTDSRGNTYEEDVVIDINDINEAPHSLTPPGPFAIDEQDGSLSNPGADGAVVAAFSATDPDGDALTFSVEDSSLAGALGFDGSNLVVTDASLIDSEAGVASIDVLVRATDPGGLFTEQWVTVNVNPLVDEDPTDVIPDDLAIAATLPAGFLLTDLLATDPDTSPDNHTFEIISDPTGGAFEIDINGTQLLLADPDLLGSNVLPNPVVNLGVRVTDSNGNTYDDTIVITVDQTGVILPFTGATVEVLNGTPGNDAFTANAGLGDQGLFPILPPGFGRTANGGDIANGGEGYDWFLLTKQDDSGDDGFTFISGVTLNDIEAAGISNRDISPAGAPPPIIDTFGLCVPCINIPDLAPGFDNPLVYEATTSPDLDFISFYQSLASVGIWDVQAPFWLFDLADANDGGPVVNIDDVTANFVHFDSDPQAKLLGAPIDTLTFTVDEVLINELLVTENASGNEPGPMRGEQVGTIRIEASGVPSLIGSLNNGAGPGDVTGSTTHTVEIEVTDLTLSSPTPLGTPAANTAAIDLFMGQFDGIGDGLLGLEFFNIGGGGDFFGVFGATADLDSDLDGNALTINDTRIDPLTGLPVDPTVSGNSLFFFEEGGFGGGGVTVNGYDGFDTIGLFAEDLTGLGDVNDVERLKLLETVGGAGFAGDGFLNLGAFDGTLDEVLLAGGVDEDLRIINIPNRIGSEHDLDVLCGAVGEPGVWINIQQKCQPGGALPPDFDLSLDGAVSDGTRVDLNFAIGAPSTVASLSVTDIDVLRINVEDPSLLIEDIDNPDGSLEALILTDDGVAGNTITILEPDQPFGSTPSLRVINGSTGAYHQRLFNITGPAMMFLPVFANWTPDTAIGDPFNDGSFNTFSTATGGPTNEVVVHADGAKFNMGSGSDWVSGNQNANGIALGAPGGTGLGADSFEMNDGNDLAFGYAGEDAMEGGNGNDELHGGAGNDTMFGDERDDPTSSGNDLMFGGSGRDRMDGGDGNDIMFGGTGRDFMVGGEGNDTLCGDEDSDCLHGGTGNDLIIGGHDNTGQLIDGINWQGDVLFAGTGIDFLIGDSTCEPQCWEVEIFAEENIVGNGDYYGIDLDGDFADDLMFTAVGDIDLDAIIADLAADFALLVGFDDWTVEVIDVPGPDNDRLLIKNWNASDEPADTPLVTATDGPDCDVVGTPAVIDLTVGGLAGVGDTFEFTVEWNGGANSRTYSYTIVEGDWTDGLDEDSFAETAPTANAVRTLLLGTGAGDPLPPGVTVAAGAGAGVIEVRSDPNATTNKVGELTVTASATDGARVDPPHTLVDAVTNGDATIEEGDIYRIDFDGDATYDYFFIVTAAEAGSQDLLFDAIAADIAATSPDHVNNGGNFLVESLNLADCLRFATVDGSNPGIEFQAQNFPGGIDEETITVDDTNKIDDGDTYTVEIDIDGDGAVDGGVLDILVTYTTVAGDTAADVAAALNTAINSGGNAVKLASAGLTTAVVGNVVTVTGSQPGVDDVYVEASNDEAGLFACDVWNIAPFDWTFGETIHVEVDSDFGNTDAFPGDNSPPIAVDVAFNTTLAQSLTDLGMAIENVLETGLGLTDVTFNVAGGVLTIQATGEEFVLGNTAHIANAGSNGLLSLPGFELQVADLFGPGNVNNITATDTAPDPAGTDDQDFKEKARDVATQDDTQSLTPNGPTTDGADSEQRTNDISIDYVNAADFSFAGNDVFVAQAVNMDAGSANWLAFQASGFDNDDIPYDFRGLLAGETMGTPGAEGPDGGVQNVTYVGDWKNGADLLAFQNEDPDGPDGPLDGSLGPAGNALNYAEFENISATRDDADATAAGIFEGAPSLRYVAIARNDGATDADNYLRVYFNAEGTDKAPEAVFELVGYDSKTDITFTDITDSTQCDLIYEGSGVSNIDDYFC